jgi:chromosome segregation ATPase
MMGGERAGHLKALGAARCAVTSRLPTPDEVRQQIGTADLRLSEARRRLQSAQHAWRALEDAERRLRERRGGIAFELRRAEESYRELAKQKGRLELRLREVRQIYRATRQQGYSLLYAPP